MKLYLIAWDTVGEILILIMAVSNEPPNILLNSVGIGKCSLQNPLKKILCWSVENESWPGASEGLVFAYNKKDQVGIIKNNNMIHW